jgi:hypothetical protein
VRRDRGFRTGRQTRKKAKKREREEIRKCRDVEETPVRENEKPIDACRAER